MRVLILEDCLDRTYRMRDALVERMPQFDHEIFRTASEFNERLHEIPVDDVILISLDHDLIPPDASDDWGDGREVAAELAKLTATCPVVLHSTNASAVAEMTDTLSEAGWDVHRVIPTDGHRWIRRIWLRTVRDLIVGQAMKTEAVEAGLRNDK